MNPNGGGLLLLLTLSSAGACGPTGSETVALTELQRVRSGNIEVLLLSREASLHPRTNTFTVEFRMFPSGRLVDVGSVKGSARMPTPAAPAMFSEVSMQPTGVPGRYGGRTDLSMAGVWQLTLEWDSAAGDGRVDVSATVQ